MLVVWELHKLFWQHEVLVVLPFTETVLLMQDDAHDNLEFEFE